MNNELLKLLENIKKEPKFEEEGKRILLLDGLNLFFRNFIRLNMVNPDGVHIGGLGGFFRSLGALIRQIQPTDVYVIFDGAGSSNNRRNVLPEYKSGREANRVTNWDVFDDRDEEDISKISQIVRIVQYLKTLPVKIISIDRIEADDIIAHLSSHFSKDEKNISFIVSADRDFLQLVSKNVVVYSPIIKEIFTEEAVKKKFGVYPYNFIIYKTLLGDMSDTLTNVKGLGPKTLYKKFPELAERKMSLQDIFDLSEERLKEHIIYARILKEKEILKKKYRIMDLNNPMLDKNEKKFIIEIVNSKELNYIPNEFLRMYREDNLGNIVKNVEIWIKENFEPLLN